MDYRFIDIKLKPGFLLAICLFLYHGMAVANLLSERNLPAGELLYTDGTNAYYGVYITNNFEPRRELEPTDKDVELRVVAFRQAEPDGTLVRFQPATIKDYHGNPIDGKRYDDSEVDLINQHIIGAVDEKFPDRRNKNYLRVLVYSKGEYFSGTPVSTPSENPDLESPELWISVLNFERENEDTPMRPAYEARGNTGLPKTRFAQGTQDTNRKPLPVAISERRSKRNAEMVIAEPVVETVSGEQVFKHQEFWDRLQFSGTVKEVFEGDFSSVSSDTFKVYFSAMQWAYSDSCKSYLPAHSIKRGYVTQNVYGDGYRDEPIERSALIAPEYVGYYDAYAEVVSRVMQQMKRNLQTQANTSIARGNGLFSVLGEAANNEPIHQLNRFIASSGGCETAAVYQLRENYLRAAKGQPSLQEAGVVLPNAAAESASPGPSLYGACMDTSDATKRYCLCFEKEALKVLTSSERRLFETDLAEYYKVVRRINARPRPPASDRAWTLSSIRSRCN